MKDDVISRQAAVDALCSECQGQCIPCESYPCSEVEVINALPSAQPGIIRCKDCKYSDENWRRVSVKWLPCMDIRPGSNWYCGSAERREE